LGILISDKMRKTIISGTHIVWPLEATRKSKPDNVCACLPALKKKFSKMPHARLKKNKTMTLTNKYRFLKWLTLLKEKEEARCPNSDYVAIACEVVNQRSVHLRYFMLNVYWFSVKWNFGLIK